jgi:hypothetical protein
MEYNHHDTMDIEETESGDKVIFVFPNNGWDHDKKHALEYLKEGETYTVSYIEIHSWHTDVYLREVPNVPFNSVHFANIKEEL